MTEVAIAFGFLCGAAALVMALALVWTWLVESCRLGHRLVKRRVLCMDATMDGTLVCTRCGTTFPPLRRPAA